MLLKTLFGRRIYCSPNNAMVFQNRSYRWLTFGSEALQTVISLKNKAKPQLEYLKPIVSFIRNNPGNVCLLGLGGGGLIHAISTYSLHSITVIEKEQEVIDIAKSYFFLEDVKNVKVINQDAFNFVQEAFETFDYLIVDLFDADSFPIHCLNDLFFSYCKNKLKPEGVLIVNLANIKEQWPIFHLIRKVFHVSTLTMPLKNSANVILFAMNSMRVTPLLQLIKRSHLGRKMAWDPKWGCVIEN